ncbi:MAG: GNAT family N-acetyltransferase [Bacillota bacterium]|nr:GNAT family N-acetyltransferase [Bacillota bacterium]
MNDKIDLTKLEKKIIIRNIKKEDIDDIVELSKTCFPNMDPWRKDQLRSHIEVFPEGQFCVEYDGKIIGASSSLIIDFNEYADKHTYDEITDCGYITNHDPEGHSLYGIAIMVHPDFRRLKIGTRLYEARNNLVRELNLKNILIAGRMPFYYKYADKLSPKEYVEQVIQHKIYDPVLTFQLLNGFTLKWVNPNYLDDDRASRQNAVLMEWNNVDYLPKSKRQYVRAFPVRICTVQYMLKKIDSFAEFARQCEYFIDVSSVYNSDFVVFPETFTFQLLSFLDEKIPGRQVQQLTEFTEDYIKLFSMLSVKYNVNIVGGSHFVEEDDQIYNVAFLFRRNGTIDRQYKLHITPGEKKWWGIQPGNELKVFDTDCGKIAILVCYDIQFPELSRMAVERGANILFTPFCTDDRQGYLRVRYCSQARAIENQVYTVIAGTVGNLTQVEKADTQYAQSGIFSPSDFPFPRDGIIGECNPNIETVVVGEIDLEILRRHRANGTVTQLKDRRKDLY